MRTHYDNLHVSEKAGTEVIRAAYKALAQKWHPDKHPDDRAKAERYFKIISAAYDTLSDPEARERYDARLASQRAGDNGNAAERERARSKAAEEAAGKARQENARQEEVAQAWQDGRRSRELGHKVSGCPYKDADLASAWREGFRAGLPVGARSSSKGGRTFLIIVFVIVGIWFVANAINQNGKSVPRSSVNDASQSSLQFANWPSAQSLILSAGYTGRTSVEGTQFYRREEFRSVEDLAQLQVAISTSGSTEVSRNICEPIQKNLAGILTSGWTSTLSADAGTEGRVACVLRFTDGKHSLISVLFTEWVGSRVFQLTLKQLPVAEAKPTTIAAAKAQAQATQQRQPAASKPSANPYPSCVFRAVMSDADYIACGINQRR